jgi:hypothetical protein
MVGVAGIIVACDNTKSEDKNYTCGELANHLWNVEAIAPKYDEPREEVIVDFIDMCLHGDDCDKDDNCDDEAFSQSLINCLMTVQSESELGKCGINTDDDDDYDKE